MAPLTNLQARAVETLIHPYTNLASFRETGPLLLERGQGVWVYDDAGKGYMLGAQACIDKPVEREELLQRLDEFIARAATAGQDIDALRTARDEFANSLGWRP